ncbi:hypothetical protein I79_008215 [Cricetulus griseus]|uniref:Uncharacterized protein n=1 Tax=Cricetulus griseus TaxID=10029 RepID=G3HCK4_CRIGR|nr:hypothetical protein I79_008215 [Cricetulus griseus]
MWSLYFNFQSLVLVTTVFSVSVFGLNSIPLNTILVGPPTAGTPSSESSFYLVNTPQLQNLMS